MLTTTLASLLSFFSAPNPALPPERGPTVEGQFYSVAASGDASRIVFASTFDLLKLGGTAKEFAQCYAYDAITNRISLLSRTEKGAPIAAYCGYPGISQDGRFATFMIDTKTGSRGPGISDEIIRRDYFRVGLEDGKRVRYHVDERASRTNGDLQPPRLSADGSKALLCSQSAEVPGTTYVFTYPNGRQEENPQVQLIEVEIAKKTVRLVSSIDGGKTPFARGGCWGDYSDDGKRALVEGSLSEDQARALGLSEKKLSFHTFLRDLETGTLTLVTAREDGTPFTDWLIATRARISGDGRYALFETHESAIVERYKPAGHSSAPGQLVRKDLRTGRFDVLSIGPTGVPMTSSPEMGEFAIARHAPNRVVFVSRENKILPDGYFPGTSLEAESPFRVYALDSDAKKWTVGEHLGDPSAVRLYGSRAGAEISADGNLLVFSAERVDNPKCTESTPYADCYEEIEVVDEERNTTDYYNVVKRYRSNDIFIRDLRTGKRVCVSCAWGG
jgi:hypothetical protein